MALTLGYLHVYCISLCWMLNNIKCIWIYWHSYLWKFFSDWLKGLSVVLNILELLEFLLNLSTNFKALVVQLISQKLQNTRLNIHAATVIGFLTHLWTFSLTISRHEYINIPHTHMLSTYFKHIVSQSFHCEI